jgi:hypothetical protein
MMLPITGRLDIVEEDLPVPVRKEIAPQDREDPDPMGCLQDATETQREADAERDCLVRQQDAGWQGLPIACLDCSGCEGGQQLLQDLAERRAREEERSAAALADEVVMEGEDVISDDGGYH